MIRTRRCRYKPASERPRASVLLVLSPSVRFFAMRQSCWVTTLRKCFGCRVPSGSSWSATSRLFRSRFLSPRVNILPTRYGLYFRRTFCQAIKQRNLRHLSGKWTSVLMSLAGSARYCLYRAFLTRLWLDLLEKTVLNWFSSRRHRFRLNISVAIWKARYEQNGKQFRVILSPKRCSLGKLGHLPKRPLRTGVSASK